MDTELYIEIDGIVSIVEKDKDGNEVSRSIMRNEDVAQCIDIVLQKSLTTEMLDTTMQFLKEKFNGEEK